MATTCSILINTAGGLGIFLLGLNQLSEGLQAVAGKRLRKIVAACTSNRFVGIVTGAFVTGIVQSSSVVTVMVVGLVTAGVMTLRLPAVPPQHKQRVRAGNNVTFHG